MTVCKATTKAHTLANRQACRQRWCKCLPIGWGVCCCCSLTLCSDVYVYDCGSSQQATASQVCGRSIPVISALRGCAAWARASVSSPLFWSARWKMSGVTGLEEDTYIKSILRLLRLLSSSVKVASSGVCTKTYNQWGQQGQSFAV